MFRRKLVLLPGMDGSGLLFGPLLRALPSGIEPVVVSYPPDIPLTYEQLLPRVKNILPSDEPYVLLGESFSGPLAIRAAAERPPGLEALVLCGTFIRNPVPWIPVWTRHLAIAPFFFLSRPFVIAKALLAGYGSPEILALLRHAHAPLSPAVMRERAKAVMGINVTRELRNITVPLFFVGGADDKVSPARNLRDILGARPDVKVTLLPGPHLILQTRPAECATVLNDIIRSTAENHAV